MYLLHCTVGCSFGLQQNQVTDHYNAFCYDVALLHIYCCPEQNYWYCIYIYQTALRYDVRFHYTMTSIVSLCCCSASSEQNKVIFYGYR